MLEGHSAHKTIARAVLDRSVVIVEGREAQALQVLLFRQWAQRAPDLERLLVVRFRLGVGVAVVVAHVHVTVVVR